MRDDLRLYFRYLGISVRAQMQYRASFLMLAVAQLLLTGTEFLAIWALFDRFGSLRGWKLAEVALLYGIVNIGFAVGEGVGRGFDIFPNMVKTGAFDRFLLRPRSTALQVAGLELQLMRVGRLVQAVIVLAWAVTVLNLTWDVGRILLLLGAIAGAACLFYGLFVLQGTLSFWTVETVEIMNTVTYGGTETAQFPLSIYRNWLRWFFTLVIPLAWVSYWPAHPLLGRPAPDGLPPALLWAAPVAGVLFLLLSFRIWNFGVRHYHSTGS
jgi:ABC-2 type transport system permease protein